MKGILFLVAITLLLSSSQIEMMTGIRTPVEKYAGKVKTLTETEYMAWPTRDTTGKSDTLRWRSTVIKNFDKDGKEHDEGYYKPTGELLNTNTPKYDAKGNNTEIWSVDKHHQQFIKILNAFDSLGNKVEETHYNQKDSMNSRFLYKYDAHGNCTEWIRYNNKKVNTSRHILTYDANNNNIKEVSFIMGRDKAFEKYEFKYNDKGEEIEKKYYRGDSIVGRDVNTYDEHGNIATTMHYSPNGQLEKELSSIQKYEYDKTGNWIKHETLSADGKPRYRTVRKIEYY